MLNFLIFFCHFNIHINNPSSKIVKHVMHTRGEWLFYFNFDDFAALASIVIWILALNDDMFSEPNLNNEKLVLKYLPKLKS